MEARSPEEILDGARTIAVVGMSRDPSKASHRVGRYLKEAGFRVYAVNPTAGEIDGERAYPSLRELPEAIDIVDIFRRPEDVPPVVEDAIAIGAGAVWMQLGIVHEEAAARARAEGLDVVMDRCIAVEHGRLARADGA